MPAFRIVLDANVIVSALIRPDSVPGRILRAAVEETAVRLVTSNPLLEELRAVLEYPRLQRYLKMSQQDKEEFVILLEQIADPVNIVGYPAPGVCRDPDDEPYLQTALAGRADYLVSGDQDLLDLHAVDDLPIILPTDFERILFVGLPSKTRLLYNPMTLRRFRAPVLRQMVLSDRTTFPADAQSRSR